MSFIVDAESTHNRKVAEGCYNLTFRAPEITGSAQPGQFVHLRCGPTLDPLLRRPLGIQGVKREQELVQVLYQIVGKGTRLLTAFEPGGRVNVLGPLGRGFTLPAGARRAALIAGGLGIAPLCFLYEELAEQGIAVEVFHGVRSAGQVSAHDLIPDGRVLMASDDGSLGYHGSVVKMFEDHIGLETFDFFFATGPSPMLRALGKLAEQHNLPGQVSLEERMGCGIGACLCCNCRTKDKDEDGWRYSRVCADGPVFPVEEVVWP
ncbi:MAG: dihydroorotate dehydrogenase electron transfer subunit [Bacillota bacterium]|nr:dihydroorotate dehydrogenase electron transfer subunit [Bacillota bacterium]